MQAKAKFQNLRILDGATVILRPLSHNSGPCVAGPAAFRREAYRTTTTPTTAREAAAMSGVPSRTFGDATRAYMHRAIENYSSGGGPRGYVSHAVTSNSNENPHAGTVRVKMEGERGRHSYTGVVDLDSNSGDTRNIVMDEKACLVGLSQQFPRSYWPKKKKALTNKERAEFALIRIRQQIVEEKERARAELLLTLAPASAPYPDVVACTGVDTATSSLPSAQLSSLSSSLSSAASSSSSSSSFSSSSTSVLAEMEEGELQCTVSAVSQPSTHCGTVRTYSVECTSTARSATEAEQIKVEPLGHTTPFAASSNSFMVIPNAVSSSCNNVSTEATGSTASASATTTAADSIAEAPVLLVASRFGAAEELEDDYMDDDYDEAQYQRRPQQANRTKQQQQHNKSSSTSTCSIGKEYSGKLERSSGWETQPYQNGSRHDYESLSGSSGMSSVKWEPRELASDRGFGHTENRAGFFSIRGEKGYSARSSSQNAGSGSSNEIRNRRDDWSRDSRAGRVGGGSSYVKSEPRGGYNSSCGSGSGSGRDWGDRSHSHQGAGQDRRFQGSGDDDNRFCGRSGGGGTGTGERERRGERGSSSQRSQSGRYSKR
jgi:hypothetical protein